MSKVAVIGTLPTPNQILAELIGMEDEIDSIAVACVFKDERGEVSFSACKHETLVYMARMLGKRIDDEVFPS